MKTFYLNIVFAIIFIASMGAKAAECSIPIHDNTFLGDTNYSPFVCSQPLRGVWGDFGLTESRWIDFGWNEVCSIDSPLNRTLSALWLLQNSAPDPTNSINDNSGDFLRQAYNYSAINIEKLVPGCGDDHPGIIAITFPEELVSPSNETGETPFSKNRIELYVPFFYNQAVSVRASTIVHEARHTQGITHDPCFCLRGSCDRRWGDQKANDFEIYFLYLFANNGVNTTTAMKRRARQEGNEILTTAYCEVPFFRI